MKKNIFTHKKPRLNFKQLNMTYKSSSMVKKKVKQPCLKISNQHGDALIRYNHVS